MRIKDNRYVWFIMMYIVFESVYQTAYFWCTWKHSYYISKNILHPAWERFHARNTHICLKEPFHYPLLHFQPVVLDQNFLCKDMLWISSLWPSSTRAHWHCCPLAVHDWKNVISICFQLTVSDPLLLFQATYSPSYYR